MIPWSSSASAIKIFAALAAIDADVVGLIEIENNGTAVQDLVSWSQWFGWRWHLCLHQHRLQLVSTRSL